MSFARDGKSNVIIISALRVFDDRGDNLVKIDQNDYWIKPDTHYVRPDWSTLIAYDHSDAEVLRIHLVNDRVVTVTGIFLHPGSKTVRVAPGETYIENGRISNSCFGGYPPTLIELK